MEERGSFCREPWKVREVQREDRVREILSGIRIVSCGGEGEVAGVDDGGRWAGGRRGYVSDVRGEWEWQRSRAMLKRTADGRCVGLKGGGGGDCL